MLASERPVHGEWGVKSSIFTVGANKASRETESRAVRSDEPGQIVIVERNAFLRDCLQRSVDSYWPGEAVAFASLSELAQSHAVTPSALVVLSTYSLSDDEAEAELARLVGIDPPVRSMVLAKTDDLDEALAVIGAGANGYISMSAGFEVFAQAIRFVGAGGTYVPPQCLLAARQAPAVSSEQVSENGVTIRELKVIQGIRQGKPNKVIAYELNMCESTVKVHVRNIMKKLGARNRTEVAMKAVNLSLPAPRDEIGGRSPVLDAAAFRAGAMRE
jgi:DNA-binding NarL/FixJ family response regulator